jgi:NADPH:quinone reductase-like Zn-dependent oxidoreductase
MKSSVVSAYGGPEVMKYQDMPDPTPDAGDAL